MAVADDSFEGMNGCGAMGGDKIDGAEGKHEGFQGDKEGDDLAQTFACVY